MEQSLWHVEFVERGWPGMRKVDRLVYEVMYRDFGVAPDADWHEESSDTVLAVALSGEHLLGSALLVGKAGDAERQLRQLAVETATQGLGVGRALVEAIERRAASEGAHRVVLRARDQAFGFYERLGYQFASELFDSPLTGIPHRLMVKELGPPPS